MMSEIVGDPGWKPAVQLALRSGFLFPLILWRIWRRRVDAPVIIQTRAMFLSLIAFFWITLLLTLHREGGGRVTGFSAGIVVIILSSEAGLAIVAVRGRSLPGASPEDLAKSYFRSRSSAAGVASLPPLIGATVVGLGGPVWSLLLGLAFGIPLVPLAAPISRDVERMQRKLDQEGRPTDLRQVLFQSRTGRANAARA
jgi:hypothetical protein